MFDTVSRRFAALAGLLAVRPAAAQTAAPPAPREKVAYHLNQPGGDNHRHFRQVLRNLGNHVSVLPAGGFDLRVVMHGPGLGLLREAARQDPQMAASVDELKLAGVRFEICRITLLLDRIALEELYDASPEDLVESGVAQVARLQQQGFAYVKI